MKQRKLSCVFSRTLLRKNRRGNCMNGIDLFLIHYGLAAVFLIMLMKTMGVPLPIPGDLIILTAAVRVAQGKLVGWQVFFAILVPGVRGAAIVAAGLADLALPRFLLGLVLGSLLFLSLHFFLGYLGGSALSVIGRVLPLPNVLMLVLALLVLVYVIWVMAVRRQKAARAELEAMQTEQNDAAALEVWHEGMCPVCLALYTANQLRSFMTDEPFM